MYYNTTVDQTFETDKEIIIKWWHIRTTDCLDTGYQRYIEECAIYIFIINMVTAVEKPMVDD